MIKLTHTQKKIQAFDLLKFVNPMTSFFFNSSHFFTMFTGCRSVIDRLCDTRQEEFPVVSDKLKYEK